MSEGGLSVGGGLGGIGGGEPKITKGISDVGNANQADVDKFQYRLGEGEGGQAAKADATGIDKKAPSGPLDNFQWSGLKFDVAEKGQKPGMMQKFVDQAKEMVSLGRADDEKIKGLLKAPLTASSTMELQFVLVDMTAKTQLISEIAKKLVQGVQTLAKNQ